MAWDHRYRRLDEGEIIEEGDEVMTDDEWMPAANTVGQQAPNPSYASHRVYRRLKEPEAAVEITDEDIGNALTGMMRRIEAEYDQMSEEELRQRWYFTYDPERSIELNMYSFFGMLTLFGGSCRRWEEKHNGSCCVVERVRDKYILPKIREFASQIRQS